MDRMVRFRLGVVLALLVSAACLGAAHDARAAQRETPVPSLAPRATAAQWAGLVRRGDIRPLATAEGCRPLHGVFYAATDWLRLATKLAAQASPCAQYSISIPPLTSDKTRPRPDQAWRIRALGPTFHALAEIHLTAWQKWVAAGNGTWYQAGVEARRRMAAAGYDVAAGDTWALNELSSAVRRGDGTWRADMRELLRGLFDAGGEQPPVQGVVFVVGVGQRVPSVATYKARMQEWLQDSAFWVDMNTYVRDWSQEVYGDVRAYAAPGAELSTRRDALTDFLEHSDLLAAAGGAATGTANAFFARAGSPLANAAWQWGSSFGWTLVDGTLMQQFVSTQVYALRSHGVASGLPEDRWGFAWAPRNPGTAPKGEFASAAGAVLDRLAAAIRDSAGDYPADPGAPACGPAGRNVWCAGDLDGAALTPTWATFRAWSPTTLAFVSPPASVVAGAVSTPISIQPQVANVAARPQAPLAVTLTTSSPTGSFATSPAGPFTPSLALELPAGAFSTAQVYYEDTTAGTPTLTATAAGAVSGTQPLTVSGAVAVSLQVEPSSATVVLGGTASFTATAVDAFGNAIPSISAAWTLAPGSTGALTPPTGPTTTYTAAGRVGTGEVVATVETAAGPLTATAALTVTPPPVVRVAAVRYGVRNRKLSVYVTLVDARGRRVPDAGVTVLLYRNKKLYARASGRTVGGRMTFVRPASTGRYRATVKRVAAAGLRWNGKTPSNRFVRAPKKQR
ncbi:MAG TPA: hypothetical protein VH305_05195 [Gaiella sp.]|jgi:hypothetical protein